MKRAKILWGVAIGMTAIGTLLGSNVASYYLAKKQTNKECIGFINSEYMRGAFADMQAYGYKRGVADKQTQIEAYMKSDDAASIFKSVWQSGYDKAQKEYVEVVSSIFQTCRQAKINDLHCIDVLNQIINKGTK